jgi:Haloacid Dehalogenase superfamily, subfamily IB, phosphoserine phosphatase-like
MPASVLVTDFDGTITANDFYRLAVERLLPPEALGPWQEYRNGTITHLEALRRIFCQIQAPECTILEVVDAMAPSPGLARAVESLRANGWHIVVASAGCRWYIDHILAAEGVDLEVHANPGCYRDGALYMEAPEDSPFFCAETGVDKLAIVRFYQERGARVAYAGDGFTDVPAALAVPPALRFARADLADSLDKRGEGYRPFSAWFEVAEALTGETQA